MDKVLVSYNKCLVDGRRNTCDLQYSQPVDIQHRVKLVIQKCYLMLKLSASWKETGEWENLNVVEPWH